MKVKNENVGKGVGGVSEFDPRSAPFHPAD